MKYRFIQTTIFEIEARDFANAKARFLTEREPYRESSSLEVYDETKTEVHAEYDNCSSDHELLSVMFD